jgi:acetylornithine deacetylase
VKRRGAPDRPLGSAIEPEAPKEEDMATDVQAILAELVGINSVNPQLADDGAGEAAVAAWIERFCDQHGIAHALQPVEEGRPNVLAWIPGRNSDVRLLFVAHLDTVPVDGWTRDPFAAEREGTRMYGRGTCDTKGSLAAMLQALVRMRDERPRATIVVAGSADEEHRKSGARVLARSDHSFEAAVVGEPTSLEVVAAHNGSVRWQIETRGRAAHTSKPHLGINAITAMAKVVTAIDAMTADLKARAHPLIGPPTLTISLISGGVHLCTVPDRCAISIDRRLVPGESPSHAIAEVEDVLEMLRRRHPDLDVRSILPAVEDPPMETAPASPIAEVAAAACAEIAGTGTLRGVPYGTDASQLSPAGISCIVLGPGSVDQAHTVDEFVELDEVEKAVEIYRRIMLAY